MKLIFKLFVLVSFLVPSFASAAVTSNGLLERESERLVGQERLSLFVNHKYKKETFSLPNYIWGNYQTDEEEGKKASESIVSSLKYIYNSDLYWLFNLDQPREVADYDHPMNSFFKLTGLGKYENPYVWGDSYDLPYREVYSEEGYSTETLSEDWIKRFKKYDIGIEVDEKTKNHELAQAGIDNILDFKDGKNWAFRRSIENGKYDFYEMIVNGKEIGSYLMADSLSVNTKGDWAFRYFKSDKSVCGSTCAGSYYIKTTKGEYGPYDKVSSPILLSSGDVYYFIPKKKGDDLKYGVIKNGELVSNWDYVDQISYLPNGSEIFFRARLGNHWYVVVGGENSVAWDYVDMLLTSDESGDVFYRARNSRGKWFLAKNIDKYREVPFEPSTIFVNKVENTAYALLEAEAGKYSKVYSENGLWSYSSHVSYPLAVRNDGKILFKSGKQVPVEFEKEGLETEKVCNSLHCGEEYTLYLNNELLGNFEFTGTPDYLYDVEKIAKLPKGTVYEKYGANEVDYEGIPTNTLSFDNDGNLVMYELKGVSLFRNIYNLD